VGNLQEQHGSRWRRVDPLLPDSMPLPEAGPDDVALDVPGGTGLARLVRADPTTLDGTWNPAERHLLLARIGESDPAVAMDTLLSRWWETVQVRAVAVDSAVHYVAMNPLAVPFWHRCGYRPLFTNWEVRPASHLR
jgi:hypothetical protein